MAHKKGHKVGGSQGPKAGMKDKGGKNRNIIKNFFKKKKNNKVLKEAIGGAGGALIGGMGVARAAEAAARAAKAAQVRESKPLSDSPSTGSEWEK